MTDLHILDIALIGDLNITNTIVHAFFSFNTNIIRNNINSKIIWISSESVQVNIYQYTSDTIKTIPTNKKFHIIVFVKNISKLNLNSDAVYKILISDDTASLFDMPDSTMNRKLCNFESKDDLISVTNMILTEGYGKTYADKQNSYNEYDIFNPNSKLSEHLLDSNTINNKYTKYSNNSCCMII